MDLLLHNFLREQPHPLLPSTGTCLTGRCADCQSSAATDSTPVRSDGEWASSSNPHWTESVASTQQSRRNGNFSHAVTGAAGVWPRTSPQQDIVNSDPEPTPANRTRPDLGYRGSDRDTVMPGAGLSSGQLNAQEHSGIRQH